MSSIYPPAIPELSRKRRDLAPSQQAAFEAFGKAVFAGGALSAKVKPVIAVAVVHVTPCPYCINGHTKAALRAGATRAGGAYAHSALMLAVDAAEDRSPDETERHPGVRSRISLRSMWAARRYFPLTFGMSMNCQGSGRSPTGTSISAGSFLPSAVSSAWRRAAGSFAR